MSRNKREGRYAGYRFGNHYRSFSTNYMPSVHMASARYVETSKKAKATRKWFKEAHRRLCECAEDE